MDEHNTIVSSAVQALKTRSPHARQDAYERARHLLEERLRTQSPPPSDEEAQQHRSALAAAIARIESDLDAGQGPDSIAGAQDTDADLRQILWRVRPLRLALVVAGAAALAFAYVVWSAATRPSLSDRQAVETAAASAADLAPGVDGGSDGDGLPYYLRRQTVFFRSPYPPGTIIVHKFQNYLYLITTPTTAWRYGIAVGDLCTELAGLRHVVQKTRWPEWREAGSADPPDSPAAAMAGGPGNPLGARLIDLDDQISRIHGTNAPRTIGNIVARGCIRLVNDDIAHLYERVTVDAPVIVVAD